MLTFNSIEDMERYYYGDINAEMVKKADDGLYTGTTAFQNAVYGAKVWSSINYEKNAFAAIPKEPWNKSGWRYESSAAMSFPSGGIAEGDNSSHTDLPDTVSPTWASITADPKTVAHTYGTSKIAALLGDTQDDLIAWDTYKESMAKGHARAISAYLVQDVDAGTGTYPESVDRVGFTSAYSTTDYVSNAGDPDIYGYDRSAGSNFDAQVSAAGSQSADLRDLTISLIDGVWSSVTEAGGEPDVILTGYDTIKTWAGLLEAERRFSMDMATFVPRFNEASGVTPGVETGFSVSTYFDVPIIPCIDYDSSIASVRTNEISPIFFGDTRYLRFAVLQPTMNAESNLREDMITYGTFAKEGIFETVGELRCYNFSAQGKIQDIK